MSQFTIRSGNRQVVVTEQGGRFSARLYANGGETATLQAWKGKTEAGARRWAAKHLDETFTTVDARSEMLSAIGNAETAGVDAHSLDRMRLACEFFTNPAFKAAMADHVWANRVD
jgi:hypothetical protein